MPMYGGYYKIGTPCDELRSIVDQLRGGMDDYRKELDHLLAQRDALDKQIAQLREYLDTREGAIPKFEHALEVLTRKGVA